MHGSRQSGVSVATERAFAARDLQRTSVSDMAEKLVRWPASTHMFWSRFGFYGVNPFSLLVFSENTRVCDRSPIAPMAAGDPARLTRGVGGIDLAAPPPAGFRVDVLRSGRPAPRPSSEGLIVRV